MFGFGKKNKSGKGDKGIEAVAESVDGVSVSDVDEIDASAFGDPYTDLGFESEERIIALDDSGEETFGDIASFVREFYTEKGSVDCVYKEYSGDDGGVLRVEFIGRPKKENLKCSRGFYGDSGLVGRFEKAVREALGSEEGRAKLTDVKLQELMGNAVPKGSYNQLGGRIFAYSVTEDGKVGKFYISNTIVRVEPAFKFK